MENKVQVLQFLSLIVSKIKNFFENGSLQTQKTSSEKVIYLSRRL